MGLDAVIGKAPLPQLGTDAQRPEALAGPLRHVGGHHALLVEGAVRGQPVERRIHGLVRNCTRPQFVDKLQARVVSDGEQPEGNALGLGDDVGLTVGLGSQGEASAAGSGAASPGGLGSSLSLTLASIAAQMSGFSFRNTRALSLPWPIRLPS